MKETTKQKWYLVASVSLMVILGIVIIILLLTKNTTALPLLIHNCSAYGCI